MKNFIRRLKRLLLRAENYFFPDNRLIQQNMDDRQTVSHRVLLMNVQRVIPTSMILIVVEVICFSIDVIQRPHRIPMIYFYISELSLILLGVFSILLSIRALRSQKVPERYLKCIYRCFWFLFLLLAGIIALLDGYSRRLFVAPTSLFLVIAVLPLLRPKEMLFFMAIPNIVCIGALWMKLGDPRTIFYGSLVDSLFALVVSYVLYKMVYCQIETEQKLASANKKLELMAVTDFLTGLLNRFGIDKAISKLWKEAQSQSLPISVAIIDVDYFKKYNDVYGHYSGDACLSQVASVIRATFRNDAELIGRIGGEEFVVVCKNISKERMMGLVQRMRDTIARLHLESGSKTVEEQVTVSVGVVLPEPIGKKTWPDFYIQADSALYEAKHRGRNCAVGIDRQNTFLQCS